MAGAQVVQLWDGRHVLGRQRGDLFVFGFRQAPAGLATRRQLRAMGKRPGGQDITAVIVWRRGRRWAGLIAEVSERNADAGDTPRTVVRGPVLITTAPAGGAA